MIMEEIRQEKRELLKQISEEILMLEQALNTRPEHSKEILESIDKKQKIIVEVRNEL